MKQYNILIVVSMTIMLGCASKHEPQPNRVAVARVYDKFLYLDELQDVIPDDLSETDSISKATYYINTWARRELILKKAELNLTAQQKDVEKQLEDYRASLIIYTYKQKFIEQKLDTIIGIDEIKRYYNEHQPEFELFEPAVKAVLVKIPNDAPNKENVQMWYRSASAKDSVQLLEYCKKYVGTYDNFNGEWVLFSTLIRNLPVNIPDHEVFLKMHNVIEEKDLEHTYFVHIQSYKLRGEMSPISLVDDKIQSILLNKKKLNLINELENNIYQDAINYDNFELIDIKKK